MVLFSGVIGHRRFRPADVCARSLSSCSWCSRTHARSRAPTINTRTWQIWINVNDDNILFGFPVKSLLAVKIQLRRWAEIPPHAHSSLIPIRQNNRTISWGRWPSHTPNSYFRTVIPRYLHLWTLLFAFDIVLGFPGAAGTSFRTVRAHGPQ